MNIYISLISVPQGDDLKGEIFSPLEEKRAANFAFALLPPSPPKEREFKGEGEKRMIYLSYSLKFFYVSLF